VAGDAWDYLVAAVESAGDTARTTGRRTRNAAGDASSSVASATGEAKRRAAAAFDALAGRRRRTHWEWIAGAVVSGLVVGWFAASGARKAVASNGHEEQTMDLAKTERMDASVTPEF
jgi:hypothetical protein